MSNLSLAGYVTPIIMIHRMERVKMVWEVNSYYM